MKSDYKLFDMYKQEDYILAFLNINGSLYESVLDKVKQLYSPLFKAEFLKECKVKKSTFKIRISVLVPLLIFFSFNSLPLRRPTKTYFIIIGTT
jgi:hypothetical protein